MDLKFYTVSEVINELYPDLFSNTPIVYEDETGDYIISEVQNVLDTIDGLDNLTYNHFTKMFVCGASKVLIQNQQHLLKTLTLDHILNILDQERVIEIRLSYYTEKGYNWKMCNIEIYYHPMSDRFKRRKSKNRFDK